MVADRLAKLCAGLRRFEKINGGDTVSLVIFEDGSGQFEDANQPDPSQMILVEFDTLDHAVAICETTKTIGVAMAAWKKAKEG